MLNQRLIAIFLNEGGTLSIKYGTDNGGNLSIDLLAIELEDVRGIGEALIDMADKIDSGEC